MITLTTWTFQVLTLDAPRIRARHPFSLFWLPSSREKQTRVTVFQPWWPQILYFPHAAHPVWNKRRSSTTHFLLYVVVDPVICRSCLFDPLKWPSLFRWHVQQNSYCSTCGTVSKSRASHKLTTAWRSLSVEPDEIQRELNSYADMCIPIVSVLLG